MAARRSAASARVTSSPPPAPPPPGRPSTERTVAPRLGDDSPSQPNWSLGAVPPMESPHVRPPAAGSPPMLAASRRRRWRCRVPPGTQVPTTSMMRGAKPGCEMRSSSSIRAVARRIGV
eukprot:scaffold53427_cov25-Tisochrysis_lutea.AAC.2